MPSHKEAKHLPYSPAQLYDLVADVESYPEFLPWCLGARIKRWEGEKTFIAELIIGFKMFRETFKSKVQLTPNQRIEVSYIHGPLRHLHNHWEFKDQGDGTTIIEFYVDFAFRNIVLEKLVGALFHEAFKKMVGAFEERAKTLYG